MAQDTTVLFTVWFLLLLSFTQEAWAYYCEWDLCGSDQYCCGDNLCCEYVYSLWYFWVGVLFVVILLSACGGLFRYCYYNNSNSSSHGSSPIHCSSNYSPVPDDMDALGMSDNECSARRGCPAQLKTRPNYYLPREPPPPYSVAVGPSQAVATTIPAASSKEATDFNLLFYP